MPQTLRCLNYILVLCLCLFSPFVRAQVDKRLCIIEHAKHEIGVREATGHNDGPQVSAYLASCGLKPGYAWCAAFCHWSFSACHAPRMRSAWAPAWFPDDKVIYRRGSKVNGVPLPGDLAGFAWNGGRIAHIGIIEQWSESSAAIITIEGNTNNAGSREGDGVYRKRRPKSQVSLVADWIGRYVPG